MVNFVLLTFYVLARFHNPFSFFLTSEASSPIKTALLSNSKTAVESSINKACSSISMISKDKIQDQKAQIAQLFKSLPPEERALALETLLDESSVSASNSSATVSSETAKKRVLASPVTPNEGGSRKVYSL
jgi:hypothetical protein